MVDQRLTPFLPHARFQPDRRRARPAGFSVRGFTLIELMVVVALVAILLGLGVPGFRELITATRIKNASFDVFSSLIHARSEAITRNADVRICPASGTDWASSGWTIRIGPTDCTGTTLKTQDRYPNITISGPATLSFNGMGRLNAAVNPISLTAAGASAAQSRCVIIDPSGRPVTKTGACS